MQFLKSRWRTLIAATLIALSCSLFMRQFTGLSYASFNWSRFAQAYSSGNISGFVTNTASQPLPNITVYAWSDPWVVGGSGMATTNANGSYTISNLPAGQYKVAFSDYTGTYLFQYYMHTAQWDTATQVPVIINQTTPNIDAQMITLSEAAQPSISVSGGASSWSDPYTGKTNVSAWGDLTITRQASCATGTPQNVVLTIGSLSFPMTAIANNTYRVTIPRSAYAQAGTGAVISVTTTCNGTPTTVVVGTLFIDPSGYVYDERTGQPIAGATVTLYRDPTRVPKNSAPVNKQTECPTLNALNDPDWFSGEFPAATLIPSQKADPKSGLFIPNKNPLSTGSNGFYRWDVTPGCWYVVVEAENYTSKVSPVVGVIEGAEVTNLDFYMNRTIFDMNLPLIAK